MTRAKAGNLRPISASSDSAPGDLELGGAGFALDRHGGSGRFWTSPRKLIGISVPSIVARSPR
jgi:hypothetical protein